MAQTRNPAALGARTGLGNIVCCPAIDTRVPADTQIDFGAINRAAVTALRPILDRLLPGGKIIAGEYVALNPTLRRLSSFKVRVFGSRAGRWCDFATGDKGGDLRVPRRLYRRRFTSRSRAASCANAWPRYFGGLAMTEEILIAIPNKTPQRHRVTKSGLIERREAIFGIVRAAQPVRQIFCWIQRLHQSAYKQFSRTHSLKSS
jgi:hypothetical protein